MSDDLRYRILTYLKEQDRTSQIATVSTISEAMGLDEADIRDQIDILDHLDAVDVGRTLGGDWRVTINGGGKLLVEQIETNLKNEIRNELRTTPSEFEWDVFISHASEDKAPFVRDLALELEKEWRVWYDEFTLTVGDSLRQSIDAGLKRSKYGVVVLSKSFFQKQWPQWELDALATREVQGRKVILPIWFDVTEKEVSAASPLLASRLAAKASDGMESVISELRRVLGGMPAEVIDRARAAPLIPKDRTEIELTIGGSKTREPEMELSLNARHVFGPPVVPLEFTIWSKILMGSNLRPLRAYVEPGAVVEGRLRIELRDVTSVNVDIEAAALGWPFQQQPDDLWAILRYRDLDDAEHQIARTFLLTVPENQNSFQVGRPSGHMRRR